MNKLAETTAGLPSFHAAMRALARLEGEVERAETFLELDEISNIAAGLQRRYRRLPEVANRAGIINVKAETKLGQERAAMPKATGSRGQPQVGMRGITGGTYMEPPVDSAPTLAELGLDKKRAARSQKLATVAGPRIKSGEDPGHAFCVGRDEPIGVLEAWGVVRRPAA